MSIQTIVSPFCPPECPDPPILPGGTAFDPDKIVQNVRLRRGLEGPQLILEWDAPKVIPLGGTVRIVRKLYEFSTSPYDGIVVFEGPTAAGFVDDLDLEACKCYYYTIFARELTPDLWYFSPETQASEIAIATGYFPKRLFELLPNVYILGDKLLEDQDRDDDIIALQKIFDSQSKETFNLYENLDPNKEPIRKGPLQRFIKTLAIEPDIVKGLIDCMPTLWDVDETCCGNLPALGELIGLEVNREFPCSKQRQEIKEQVAIVKLKGTRAAIRARASLISGQPTNVQEWCGNILISNRLDRTTLKVPNPGLSQTFHLFGDETDYTPGGEIGFNTFTIFFFLECEDCLSAQTVAKLNRVLRPEFPVCRVGNFVFIDCKFVECYDRRRIQEIVTDELTDQVVENFIPHCWLITNRLPDADSETLPRVNEAHVDVDHLEEPTQVSMLLPSLYLPFEHNLTNSIHSLTANPFRVCVERWWDEVEEAETYVEDLTDCVLVSNRIERISNSKRWKTPCPDSVPVPCICSPFEVSYDEVLREFEEVIGCWQTHLTLVSNRLEDITNDLHSLTACPQGPGVDFWFDIVRCIGRVNQAQVNCARINEGE
jgi:hypothetical protein